MTTLGYFYMAVGIIVLTFLIYNLIALRREERERRAGPADRLQDHLERSVAKS